MMLESLRYKKVALTIAFILCLGMLVGVFSKASAQDDTQSTVLQENQPCETCGVIDYSHHPCISVDLYSNLLYIRNWFSSPTVELYVNETFIEKLHLLKGTSATVPDERIAFGDHIRFQNGDENVSFIVTTLLVTSYDPVTRLVSGSTMPGELAISVDGSPEAEYSIIVDQTGNWSLTIPEDIYLYENSGVYLTQYDDFGNTISNSYRFFGPKLSIYYGDNSISGNFWTSFSTVTVEVNDILVGTTTTDNTGRFFIALTQDLFPGDMLKIGDGTQTVDFQMIPLSVNTIDLSNNFISGSASPGTLYVYTRNYGYRTVEVDSNGNWQADYSDSDPWTEDVSGEITQCLPQNACQKFAWFNPQYLMIVNPGSDYVESIKWKPNTSLQITIGSQTWSAVTDHAGYAKIETDSYNITAGDIVTITDGATTRSHTVNNLTISSLDAQNRIVTGTADAGVTIEIGKLLPSSIKWEQVIVDNTGNWEFVFEHEVFPDDEVYARSIDSEGHETRIVWKFGSTAIWAFPHVNQVEGRNWSPYYPVTLTIDEYTMTRNADQKGFVRFHLRNFDLAPGQVINLTDGTYSQSYTVRDFTVTSVLQNQSVVNGHADDASVIAKACGRIFVGCFFRTATTDPSGNWQADFSEDMVFKEEYHGRVYLYDDQLNATVVDWTMHVTPGFTVVPAMNMITSHGWGSHSQVSLLIDGEEIVKDRPVVDNAVGFHDLDPGLLGSGTLITLKDQNFSVSMRLGDLNIRIIDHYSDRIIGTSTDNEPVTVAACSGKCRTLIVSPDQNTHVWIADFAGALDITETSIGLISQPGDGKTRLLYHWKASPPCNNFLPVILSNR